MSDEIKGVQTIEEMTKKEVKKVAICGFAPSYKQAPFDDASFEIWGCNSLFRRIPRQDRWFDIHPFETFSDEKIKGSDHYVEELAELDCPVYLINKRPEIPNSKPYPLERMLNKFFDFPTEKYFTNSVSYMIAMAIDEGYDVIHVYGVDMAQDSEYGGQRPSCEYFLGYARGKGIDVKVPASSNLLKSHFLYGFDDNKADAFVEKEKERLQFMQEKKQKAMQQLEQLQATVSQYTGAIESGKHVLKRWAPLRDRDKWKMGIND